MRITLISVLIVHALCCIGQNATKDPMSIILDKSNRILLMKSDSMELIHTITQKNIELKKLHSNIKNQKQVLDSVSQTLQIRTTQLRDKLEQISLQEQELLEKQLELKGQESRIEIQRKILRQQDSELQRTRTIMAFSLAISLLVLVIILGISRNYKIKKRINKELEAKNTDISKQNSQILEQKEKIQEQKNQLEISNATKDKFFAIISHDLRSSIGSSLTSTEMLVDHFNEFSETETIDFLVKINKSILQTFNLLENLLQWSRTQRGEIKYQPTSFYIADLLEDNIDLFTDLAQNKQIRIELAKLPECKVMGDTEMVRTILRNLTSNALKFTGQGGTVKFSSQEKDDQLIISIKDNGVGMDEETTAMLFRLDVHISTMGTQAERGTGLGLILCKDFIQLNGGTIWVDSKPDKGSTFNFTLPKAN